MTAVRLEELRQGASAQLEPGKRPDDPSYLPGVTTEEVEAMLDAYCPADRQDGGGRGKGGLWSLLP